MRRAIGRPAKPPWGGNEEGRAASGADDASPLLGRMRQQENQTARIPQSDAAMEDRLHPSLFMMNLCSVDNAADYSGHETGRQTL
ncbi:hypothetical protein C2I19_00535 [Chromobacterium alticapitis]|uniref:Uncharacterized protein n=1 Tax=Chromobacterium alticapitis TaxID=2073169 RepID=A0A2S5DLJ1_9NEIS|nr:hypothetical protein C2I19_00535 [Chromobacterium alticapitis]